MKIYTLTLSPAYDVHAYAESFEAFHENLATITSREVGGKGVNISRALNVAEVENTAVVLLGRDNMEEFRQALELQWIWPMFIFKDGRIRENLTIHCPGMPETRISFTGVTANSRVLKMVYDTLMNDEETDIIVTFTGRVPPGIDMKQVKAFLKELRCYGMRIVLDSKSFGLEDILEVRPWLIKPNQEEISALFGCEVETLEQAAEKARIFADAGIENVMVSLGSDGALLLNGGKLYRAVPPEIQPVSTIGAGDSAIAGFLAATQQGKTPDQCLLWATAYGTAACLSEGSQPPRLEDVHRIITNVRVQ